MRAWVCLPHAMGLDRVAFLLQWCLPIWRIPKNYLSCTAIFGCSSTLLESSSTSKSFPTQFGGLHPWFFEMPSSDLSSNLTLWLYIWAPSSTITRGLWHGALELHGVSHLVSILHFDVWWDSVHSFFFFFFPLLSEALKLLSFFCCN